MNIVKCQEILELEGCKSLTNTSSVCTSYLSANVHLRAGEPTISAVVTEME